MLDCDWSSDVCSSDLSKLVPQCSYPLTGLACVKRVYTDLAVFELTGAGVLLRECVEGVDRVALERLTGLSLHEAG
jgi:3-oxoadipate CoA-transferase beta subunit